MINHFRTVLLNLPPADSYAGREDYIPPGFVPRRLTGAQASVHRAVFGQGMPRRYMAFIASLLARLAAESPFKKDLEAIDRRSILLPPRAEDIQPSVFLHELSEATAFGTVGVISGSPISGIFSNSWRIERASADSVSIDDRNIESSRTVDVTFDGISDLIRLEPASELFIRFVGASEIPEGFGATVTSTAPMIYSIYECLDRLRSSRVGELLSVKGDPGLSEKIRTTYEDLSRPDHSVVAALVAHTLSL